MLKLYPQVITGDVFTALNKAWCVDKFACSACDQRMTVKTKFYEVDLKPVCKKCYDKYPRDLRLRLSSERVCLCLPEIVLDLQG